MKLPRDLRRDLLRLAAASAPRAATRPRKAGARRAALPAVPAAGKLLAVDPSATATGWVVVAASGELIDFGLIRPTASWPLARRGEFTGGVLRGVCARYNPDAAVIEVTSGQPFRHGPDARRHNPRSLASLAFVQGVVYAAVAAFAPTHTVPEAEWTGRKPKRRRAVAVHAAYPQIAAFAESGQDRGLDVTDSGGLALWFLSQPGVIQP
jgi:Holliday junction resolvasome RuvABC endonuclease subunit